jgi:hypothetical protein
MPGSFVGAWFLSIPLLESSTFVVSHHGKTWVGSSVLASPVPNRLAVHNLLLHSDLVNFLPALGSC